MQNSTSPQIYTDFSSLTALRADAHKDPQANLRKVARQFESLYLKMMLKSMREASLGDPLFDSNSGEVYRDMFDNQLALQMSDRGGIGLADMLVRQLQQHVPANSATTEQVSLPERHENIPHTEVSQPKRFTSQEEFIEHIWPLAEEAAEELGVSPQVLMAQTALETGWGKHITQSTSGVSSHNLFNIKADQRWTGPTVVVNTLEYENGVARRQPAAFRAYDSYADSFRDYVDFLKSNPRYQDALANSNGPEEFAHNLHQAGYATDPAYARKLIDIMQREVTGSPQSEFLAAS